VRAVRRAQLLARLDVRLVGHPLRLHRPPERAIAPTCSAARRRAAAAQGRSARGGQRVGERPC
jgi:hypothetical protein